jgi:predicted NACHT family NTPase
MPYMLEHADIMVYPNKLVIVGAPGSGKTTLLKHLALLSDSGKDLGEYIDAVFEKYQFHEAKEFVESDLKTGKCQMLLDGFDELATKEQQEQITAMKKIESYRKEELTFTNAVLRCC